MKLSELDIEQLLSAYKDGLSPSEVVGHCLSEIEKSHSSYNAFLQVMPERSLERAKALESQRTDLSKFPLFGVPIAIKDNFLVQGWQATAGSKILEGYQSPYTSTAVQRLEDAGAIIIGKCNLDEFAMGSSNENSAFGSAKNPWDESCVPGGSSGGSAAAVAANLAKGALGTDTGGSIRQPASLCGVVGLKPTYGRISRYGVIAFASSLDQVGPFGQTVSDVARQFLVMAGHDPMDATSSSCNVPKLESISAGDLKGVRFGVAKDWLSAGIDDEVLASFEEMLALVKKAGAEVVELNLPHSKYALSTYYLLAPSEASSNLARFDGVHYGHRSQQVENLEDVYANSRAEGFGAEVKLRIMLGTYALSAGYYDAFYAKAVKVRAKIGQDFSEAFKQCDSILMPTSPTCAFKFGEKAADPIKMYASDICTLPVSLAGLPAISVPCGLGKTGLPIGVQFISNHFEEETLFKLSLAYEKIRGKFPIAPGADR